MHIHWLQHVPFEGLGHIAHWAETQQHTLSCTRLFEGEALPPIDRIDALIIMGGSMGVYDESDYPWLTKEKAFIRNAIEQGIPVLGICLGAQLIANALGAKITKNPVSEIGWFPIEWTDSNEPPLAVLHWHGDRFDIPEGAKLLASSEACDTQGFIYKNHVVGLQFHAEMTPYGLGAIIAADAQAIAHPSTTVQSAKQLEAGLAIHMQPTHTWLESFLDQWILK